MRRFAFTALALLVFASFPIGCDDAEEPMPLACRAQTYRYSEYTGGRNGCTCLDESFTEDEGPQSACASLFDSLFIAGSSASGSHDTEYSFVTAAPGLTCDEIVTDPCDNTEY